MGESRMFGHTETGYAHTSNDRIRKVFGARVEHASDDELDELKADDRAWFDFIYSPRNSVGKMLGNTQLDDGYNYRGRGFIQLTGRDNYRRYGEKAGHPEIVQEPDKANDPEIAAALAVAYIKDRYKGGGFERMMRCVGNNTPDIAEAKRGYYEQFSESGEAGSLLQRVQAAEAELETALANGKAFEAEIVELKDQLVALFAAPKPTEPTEIDPVTQAPSA
jgi:hypothetical protein